MAFQLRFTSEAKAQLSGLERSDPERAKKVKRALAYLESNPRHPSLQTHEYDSFSRIVGVKIFEAYVENQTPGAYRIFWYYGPGRSEITIYTVTPHPQADCVVTSPSPSARRDRSQRPIRRA